MHIPGYDVLATLGQTARFRLYRGRHAQDRSPALLKVPARVPPPGADVEALERELNLSRGLDIPGVVSTRELVRRGDVPCLVLEDAGLDLLSALMRGERPTLRWVLGLGRRLGGILHVLHEQGIVVGSVAPTGVLVDRSGENLQLADLSVASRLSADGTTQAIPAPPGPYTSPEQTGRLNRTVDYRSDFYALGITLYELLVGRPPSSATDPLELIHFHIAKTPVPPAAAAPGVPEQVSRIIMRLLAKDPDDRYQSALGLQRDIDACIQQLDAHGHVEPFDLGRDDVSSRFLIPNRLYGRRSEVDALTRVFDSTCEGRSTLLLVSGYSGVGKTSLISELYRPIVRQRGSFTSGKFDQVMRDIPYGALAHAFRMLVRKLLTESEERLSAWRQRLTSVLGTNGGVLVEVIPEIELVIGKQPVPPHLEPTEAQNRFRYVLQGFVSTLADRDHPLVVFLDDLQWVDAATLELLHAVLTSPDISHLLVIGAYRENEVDEAHLLTWATGRLTAAGGSIERLSLAPLGGDDLLAFLSDTLRGPLEEIEPLSQLILEKTDGNPFFVIQFLKALVQDGLVSFDGDQRRWTFRIDAVRGAGITDNVIDLMTRRIKRLSARAQRTLTLASSIGNRFAWTTLVTVSRQPPDEVAAGLFEAVDAGLIQRAEDPYGADDRGPAQVIYTFLHDRVQQAAYGMIPEDRKAPVHLDVGRLLLADCDSDVPDDRVFEVTNHLNIGSGLITSDAERLLVARLNLSAGRKAKMSTAYRSAAMYFEQGIALLADGYWTIEYSLIFALHLEAAECQYLAGNFDHAETYFRILLDRAVTSLDRAQVHALRITLYENQSRWTDAMAAGREGLALFGVRFPDDLVEAQAVLESEVSTTQRLLGGRMIASLVDLPVAADPEVRMTMRLLTILWAPAYIAGNQLLARLISATMVRLSMERGNTEDSAYGYVTHAITIGPIRRDYASAYEWGELALAVNDRFGDPRLRARIHQQFQAHVNPWRRPFETCIPHAREARRSGLETGDFVYAGYGTASESWPAFAACRSLETFVRDYTPSLSLLDRLKMTDFRASQRVMLNWALALQGRTAGRLQLSDGSFDEDEYEGTYTAKAPFFLTFLYAARLHLSLLFEAWPEAVAQWRRVREVSAPGIIWPVLADGWGGLALAAMSTGGETSESWPELVSVQESLGALADNCPENFRGPWLLISAEMARSRGNVAEALRHADQAIRLARETDNRQLEAMANDVGGRIRLSAGDDREAIPLLTEAIRCYTEWGAVAKARDLEDRHASLLGDRVSAPTDGWVAGDGARSDDPASLDMATVLKLARAIAIEIKLDDLLRKLMTIAMENAGAKRSVFLVARDEGLTVAAEAVADPEHVTLGLAEPLEESARVPRSVVQFVRRTGQDLVIGHAAADEAFGGDPYVERAQTRSLLCVPVSHQGRLGGVLYLENDLTADAFTPQRSEMMRILAAQAAISLENARLYEGMAGEVARRTQAESALREALDEVEGFKNRLEAENVYLQEEIQTQHNFSEIVGNSPVLREALRNVERVAATGSTVLITGETGTGKEIIARAIHVRSARRDRPLVKVNCGAIPAGLVESELFGHVKGAFTGALQKRSGRFELADQGSIFLDEVGELPLDTQVKLLRVLQEQEFEPVGAARPVRVDVRVIAATNRDLEAMVKAGTFRADLFYRLNVFPITVPPLRERKDDISLLVAFFLTGLAKRLGKPLQGFTATSLDRLRQYAWPGNVRELQNVVERAAILAQGPIVELHPELLPEHPTLPAAGPSVHHTLEELERQHILTVVRQTNWTIEGQKGAAVILGLHPNTLRSRMKKLGIAKAPHDIS